jgi:hypothetical protein
MKFPLKVKASVDNPVFINNNTDLPLYISTRHSVDGPI